MGDQQERGILLHIMSKEGCGKLLNKTKSSMKQIVCTPTTMHKLVTQLSYLHGAVSIFFGKCSIITERIYSLESTIKNHKASFHLKTLYDKSFPTKFLYAVDTKIQRWLLKCKVAQARNKVDDRNIDFKPLVSMVLDHMCNM